MPLIPIGIDLVTLYPENRIAQEANNAFVINLLESVAIVIALIMLIMGLRSGMLIGSSLIFSIGGTLLIMQFLGVGLNRTSLAGFIIAMGMLVDNAIVVTDNARNGMLFTAEGTINIKNRKWADDFSPIDPAGYTWVDTAYTKAYLRHLFAADEFLGKQIASVHNLGFYLWLVEQAREHIKAGDFSVWKDMMVRKLDTRL